jgi:adenosylcobinamide-GDP ribazoletransferase
MSDLDPAADAAGGVFGDGLRLSIGTLTALPVRPPSTVDRARARVAMLLAPAVALLPGAAAALVATVAIAVRLNPLVAAALVVGALALATRGLHLDGLADTADGLAASYDRARALDVMRRGNTGPAGVAMVVLVLVVQVAALAQALQKVGPVAVPVAVVAGRLALPLLCARGVPAARSEGLGAAMAGSVPRMLAATVTVLTVLAGAGLTMRLGTSPPPALALVFGALAVLASALVAALLARRAVRRLGGVTGDVLGACVEVGTAAALVVLAAVPPTVIRLT